LLRTCLAERPVLLLDEPFGALDPVTRRRMNSWLASVRLTERTAEADAADPQAATGSGVVLVTHDIDEAIALADRIVVMSDRPGRVVHEAWAQPSDTDPYDRDALLAALDG
jgi:ABC-type nitrate/sulfonate/bicarbonate transport system ATPase subunit